MMFFPLSKETVETNGWKWQGDLPGTYGKETIQPEAIPDDIHDIPEKYFQEVLVCQRCAKNHKLIEQELQFYKSEGLPIPRFCPDCRLEKRMKLKNPARLYLRECDCGLKHLSHSTKCSVKFYTSYSPSPAVKVYCEACYQSEVY